MRLLMLSLLALAPLAAAPAKQAAPGAQPLSMQMQIVVLLTLLTMLPAVLMSLTPFLRISLVLHFLRQAMGTQSAPSNQVLIGLSLFLALFVMKPVANDVYANAWGPYEKGQIQMEEALQRASVPMKSFMLRFAREKDIQLFLEISKTPAPQKPADLDMMVLMPAYILSELKAGFQIGTVLFLPFLIIDIVIASVTVSIGMMQLPPMMISAPFKILLFVLVDGWNLVVGSLVKSFY